MWNFIHAIVLRPVINYDSPLISSNYAYSAVNRTGNSLANNLLQLKYEISHFRLSEFLINRKSR